MFGKITVSKIMKPLATMMAKLEAYVRAMESERVELNTRLTEINTETTAALHCLKKLDDILVG